MWSPVSICIVMIVSLLIVATYAFTVTENVAFKEPPAAGL